jgi:hypothetical protein
MGKAVLFAGEEAGLEVSVEKAKCVVMWGEQKA